MSTIVVDWLGRGGIAQTTEAWALELERAGEEVVVATRRGRELADTSVPTLLADPVGGRLRTHVRLVRTVARGIRERRPDTVVLQNFLVAPLEEPVHRAARSVGARIIQVVHDQQHHTRTSGVQAGLTAQLRKADVVIAHTRFVADSVERACGRPVEVLPLPLPLGVLEAERPAVAPFRSDRSIALHLGVLTRAENKGTAAVVELATHGLPGWQVAFAGVGAPAPPGALSLARFLTPGELAAVVEGSATTLLPYRFASQSGVVPLAQALGSVPVVTRVGGLTEQVEDGVTGIVLPAGAGAADLMVALRGLDPGALEALAAKARDVAWTRHRDFVAGLAGLVGRR